MTEVVDFLARTGLELVSDLRLSEAAPVMAAVDLGEGSYGAVIWASELAEQTGAPLQILHVLHDPAESPGRYVPYKIDPLEPMADTAARMMSDFMAELRQDRPDLKVLAAATTKLAKGLPAQTIVKEAGILGAGLIVIGCRGKTGLEKMLYGSNAERVTRLSPIPVTVVKTPLA